jgi:Skp family chaperone for outer membrane proteins
MARRLALLFAGVLAASPVLAQQQPEWFVPGGGGQQRPQGAQPQQPRPPQGQAPRPQQARPGQPPRTDGPQPLPPGQQPPTVVVGVVDVPEVQRVSTAFAQVREEIERRRVRLNDDLQREQLRWREEQQRLAADRPTLNPDQLRNRERELQDRITDAQRVFRDRQRNIEQAAQQSLGQIEQALGVVIRQVAASRNVNMILPRGVIIFNEAGFDLTEEVAQKVNEAIQRVAIPPEEGAPPAPAAATPPARPAAPAAPATPPRRN